LPCPAGRSVPGRGGPERRRRPRPDGTDPRSVPGVTCCGQVSGNRSIAAAWGGTAADLLPQPRRHVRWSLCQWTPTGPRAALWTAGVRDPSASPVGVRTRRCHPPRPPRHWVARRRNLRRTPTRDGPTAAVRVAVRVPGTCRQPPWPGSGHDCYRNRSPGRRPPVGCSQRWWARPSRAVSRSRSWLRT
jgi:hypothetical protein